MPAVAVVAVQEGIHELREPGSTFLLFAPEGYTVCIFQGCDINILGKVIWSKGQSVPAHAPLWWEVLLHSVFVVFLPLLPRFYEYNTRSKVQMQFLKFLNVFGY